MRAEELKGHLDALLLAALEDGPRHGYAVMDALRQSTGGRLDLPTDDHPALHRWGCRSPGRGRWGRGAGAPPADCGRASPCRAKRAAC
jgi:hypothetical protein